MTIKWTPGETAVIVFFVIFLCYGMTFTFLAYGIPSNVTGKVVAIDAVWHGGDLQTFENATVAYDGYSSQMTFGCHFYNVGDTLTVQYSKGLLVTELSDPYAKQVC